MFMDDSDQLSDTWNLESGGSDIRVLPDKATHKLCGFV